MYIEYIQPPANEKRPRMTPANNYVPVLLFRAFLQNTLEKHHRVSVQLPYRSQSRYILYVIVYFLFLIY